LSLLGDKIDPDTRFQLPRYLLHGVKIDELRVVDHVRVEELVVAYRFRQRFTGAKSLSSNRDLEHFLFIIHPEKNSALQRVHGLAQNMKHQVTQQGR
jgi:hypothetical protein